MNTDDEEYINTEYSEDGFETEDDAILNCPQCETGVSMDAVICTSCGYMLQGGGSVKTKITHEEKSPPKTGKKKKKKKKFSILKVIAVLFLVFVYFILIKPTLFKMKIVKCKHNLIEISNCVTIGGGLVHEESTKCPGGTEYQFFIQDRAYQVNVLAFCPAHNAAGLDTNEAIELKKGEKIRGRTVSKNEFFKLKNINSKFVLDAVKEDFNTARKKHKTTLDNTFRTPAETEKPPVDDLKLIKYPTAIGNMDAYVSVDPNDGKKHPAIIWIHGGFSTAIGSNVWKKAKSQNDQSAAQFRKNGVITMYPSFRGSTKSNPGKWETFRGEIDDCLDAVEYLTKLPYVDPKRIYLGGHSTGGTMALLIAAASQKKFRAVFSFGPVEDTRYYGRANTNMSDSKEWIFRAPALWLKDIKVPTFVMEGDSEGNLDSLLYMKKHCKNDLISFHPLKRYNHFSYLSTYNARIAKAIIKDSGISCNLKFPFD